MKTNSTFALATLGLAAILTPMHLAAQSNPMDVTVPFNFAIGAKALPAGDYKVTNDCGIIRLDSVDGNAHMAAIGIAVETKNGETKLVFKKYGDRYFLAQVWSGAERGAELPRSAVERELSAKNHATPVTLFASLR
jgi:hypothetical protein